MSAEKCFVVTLVPAFVRHNLFTLMSAATSYIERYSGCFYFLPSSFMHAS